MSRAEIDAAELESLISSASRALRQPASDGPAKFEWAVERARRDEEATPPSDFASLFETIGSQTNGSAFATAGNEQIPAESFQTAEPLYNLRTMRIALVSAAAGFAAGILASHVFGFWTVASAVAHNGGSAEKHIIATGADWSAHPSTAESNGIVTGSLSARPAHNKGCVSLIRDGADMQTLKSICPDGTPRSASTSVAPRSDQFSERIMVSPPPLTAQRAR